MGMSNDQEISASAACDLTNPAGNGEGQPCQVSEAGKLTWLRNATGLIPAGAHQG